MNPSDAEIKNVLTKFKTIVVVGLSPQADRPSHDVTEYMIHQGYRIFGVRPGGLKSILARPCFEKLNDVNESYDIVNVFRANEFIPEVVDEVLKTKAKVLWLQLGITHPEAEEKARKAGLIVISNRCILVEHRRLIGI